MAAAAAGRVVHYPGASNDLGGRVRRPPDGNPLIAVLRIGGPLARARHRAARLLVAREAAARADPAPMSVCALVVTYHRWALLEECLRAIDAQSVRPAQLILVDNASTDGTPDRLRERGWLDRPDVRFLRLDENLGSSGGFARGFEAARDTDAEWLWTMDDDAEPALDCLERLLASPPAGRAGTRRGCA